MTDEELVALIKAGVDVRRNMEFLYKQRRGYIYYFAKRYIGIADIEDLMQEGYFGLANAVENYDESKYPRFTDYLKYHLIRTFNNYLQETNSKGKLTRWSNDQVRNYIKVKSFFKENIGREPTIVEYVAYLRTSAEVIHEIEYLIHQRNIVSLDKQIDDNPDSDTYVNALLSNGKWLDDDVVDSMVIDDMQTGLWEIVRAYTTEDEYNVICSIYKKNMTVDSCASKTGVTAKEVRNRLSRGIGRLKSSRVKSIIIERFGLEYVQDTTKNDLYKYRPDHLAIKNVENEINYITYVLASTVDGFRLLNPHQVQMAYDEGIIGDNGEIRAVRKEIRPGIKPKPIDQYDLNGTFIKRWDSASEAANTMNISESSIRRCINGYLKTASRYVWKEAV